MRRIVLQGLNRTVDHILSEHQWHIAEISQVDHRTASVPAFATVPAV